MPLKDKAKRKEYQKSCSRRWEAKNKDKRRQFNKNNREKVRKWFKEFKSTLACIKCGEARSACLDFHHRDPSKKVKEISVMVNWAMTKEKIMAEVAKCDVLCKNCHVCLKEVV